jgi:uncharacterized protein (UPF0548 family)
MAEWRFLRGWTDAELAERLRAARTWPRNFSATEADMTPDRGWGRHYSTAIVGREPSGPPVTHGAFERAWPHIERYAFSDPRIVRGHFDAGSPLPGRVMLIEARVLGLRYLGAVTVAAVRDERDEARSVRGFRYDTLQGHFERGMEWFLLTKEHVSGNVTFTVHAGWQRGDLPNVWSRIGFRIVAQRYQRAWHRLAHLRLRALLGSMNLEPLPRGSRLVHSGPPLPTGPVQTTASGSPPAPVTTELEAREGATMEAS